ncbi:MAG: hypothetical protein M3454_08240 [Actinomycetota bacterium]|nr:hypothetical protein [Actinomycetota bacterium]
MASSFCPTCSSTVEDKDGYCLLGHPLRKAPEESLLADIRREVDDAFEDSSLGLEPVGAKETVSDPDTSNLAPSTTPEVVTATKFPQLGPRSPRYLPPEDPISAFAPPPRMDWGPAHTPLRRLLGRAPRSES